jgi:thiosulfate sulfurtransferase
METSITASELKSALSGPRPPLVIDVRRSPAYRSAPDMIAGALRRDPEGVASWAAELPVVVYCVHGHEVSQGVATALRQRGISAQYLEGGIEEGWRAAGGDLDRKPAGANTQ